MNGSSAPSHGCLYIDVVVQFAGHLFSGIGEMLGICGWASSDAHFTGGVSINCFSERQTGTNSNNECLWLTSCTEARYMWVKCG